MARPTIVSEEWMPRWWHGVQGKKRRWKCDDDGIHVRGEEKLRRTKGQPVTIRRIVKKYGNTIANMAETFGMGEPMLAATIAIESGGRPKAERFEKHLNDWSIGLTQTLTNTALAVAKRIGVPTKDQVEKELRRFAVPTRPVPKGGDLEEWRAFLSAPWNSVALGAAYHQMNNVRFKLQHDPVLLYACFNAGSPRLTDKNAWGLVYHGGALDWFVKWFNDACHVYGRSM